MASRKQIVKAMKTLLGATVAIDNVMRLPLFVAGGDADLIEARRLIWVTMDRMEGLTDAGRSAFTSTERQES